MANGRTAPQWQRSIVLLSGTVVAVVAVSVLYWAQSIFIPVALAIFLTFLLNPVVSRLRTWGLRRTPAVILTVFTAALLLGVTCWIVTVQVSSLLRELPEHTETVKAKIKSLKTLVEGSGRFARMVEEIDREIKGAPASPHAGQSHSAENPAQPPAQPRAVIIEPQSPVWLGRITSFLSPLMECLGEFALAIILVIFMLQQREEFRNRVIRLVGYARVAPATKFVDEAGNRISRFLLLQALVNGSFGLLLGFGLLALGVKYALLWGFLGAMLRYLPYIGPYLAAFLPVSTALALNEGWATTLLVIGLFLTLELVIANVIEPRLYGQSMGVSEVALLVSAAFWAFLWGPIGLVLSSPLTVCMVMLGRYVPQLEFLAVLLGDEPALNLKDSFFQRLLARDQDEAEDLILERLETAPPDEIFDNVLVPALCSTRQSVSRGEITEADEQAIMHSLGEIVDDLGDILGRPGCSGPGEPRRRVARARRAGVALCHLRLPSPRRRRSCRASNARKNARSGTLANEVDCTANLDIRAPGNGCGRATESGVHRIASAGGAGAHAIFMQAAERSVSRAADRRRPLGRGIQRLRTPQRSRASWRVEHGDDPPRDTAAPRSSVAPP